jgi:hypothetical protein
MRSRLLLKRINMLPLLFIAAIACSQQGADPDKGSPKKLTEKDSTILIGKTKLQSFQARTGTVVVLGFSRVATVPGLYGASTDIEARELTEATSGSRAPGVSVTVRESGSFERKETSYIDYDELESLLRGIDYIARIDHNPTKLADFQADYRTKGDLAVSTFSDASGKTMVAIKSGVIRRHQCFLSFVAIIGVPLRSRKSKSGSGFNPPFVDPR